MVFSFSNQIFLYCRKHDSVHVLPRRDIATNVPEKAAECPPPISWYIREIE